MASADFKCPSYGLGNSQGRTSWQNARYPWHSGTRLGGASDMPNIKQVESKVLFTRKFIELFIKSHSGPDLQDMFWMRTDKTLWLHWKNMLSTPACLQNLMKFQVMPWPFRNVTYHMQIGTQIWQKNGMFVFRMETKSRPLIGQKSGHFLSWITFGISYVFRIIF